MHKPALKSNRTLHLISFDVPFPANYGGVIDIFYKIKALHRMGIHVILHCFEYGRDPSAELQPLCKKVYYYPRKTFKNFLIGNVPYIVASRDSSELLGNLLKDNHPILFEGLHTTFHLKHPALKNRFKIVRTHNVEHDYYHHLEMVEKNFFKRYFFKLETEKLKKYQSILKYADLICAISPKDARYFQKKFGKTLFIPAFHSNQKVCVKTGSGTFALYHGNLAVGENHEAAMFLIRNVFSKLKLPFVVAGSHPKKELKQLAAQFPHIRIMDHASTEEIHQLIRDAHINILYTLQDTGIKLKLLNALYQGRHCIVNDKMVVDTGLESLCVKANSPEDFVKATLALWNQPVETDTLLLREQFFAQHFNNDATIAELTSAISFSENPLVDPSENRILKSLPKKRKVSTSLGAWLGLLPF